MIEEKINELRKKLDDLVEKNAPYDEVYKVSLELDKYIAMYYQREI